MKTAVDKLKQTILLLLLVNDVTLTVRHFIKRVSVGKAKLSSSFLTSTDRFTAQNLARSFLTRHRGFGVDKKGHSWTAAWTLNQPKIGSALGQISRVLTLGAQAEFLGRPQPNFDP